MKVGRIPARLQVGNPLSHDPPASERISSRQASGSLARMRLCQAEQIVDSPVGSVVLALLELAEREDVARLYWEGDCDLTAVEAVIHRESELEYTDLLKHVLLAVDVTSPWNPDSEDEVEAMRLHATKRLPIAELLVSYFADRLTTDCELDLQEIWLNPTQYDKYLRSRYFVEHRNTYGQGQFTWAGMWSTTRSDPEIVEWMIQDMGVNTELNCYRPVIADGARVYEIQDFEDWVKLVNENKLGTLSGASVPDWSTIAKKYDAVHLSWMGLLLAHDGLTPARDNNIIPLRYWSRERTLWLNDCFSELVKLT